jgi:hypothetical protein
MTEAQVSGIIDLMADEQTLPVNGSRKDGMQAFRSDEVLENQKPLQGSSPQA